MDYPIKEKYIFEYRMHKINLKIEWIAICLVIHAEFVVQNKFPTSKLSLPILDWISNNVKILCIVNACTFKMFHLFIY